MWRFGEVVGVGVVVFTGEVFGEPVSTRLNESTILTPWRLPSLTPCQSLVLHSGVKSSTSPECISTTPERFLRLLFGESRNSIVLFTPRDRFTTGAEGSFAASLS